MTHATHATKYVDPELYFHELESQPLPIIDLAALDLTDDEPAIVRGILDEDGRLRETRPDLELDAQGRPTSLSAATAYVWKMVISCLSPREDHVWLVYARLVFGFHDSGLPDDAERLHGLAEAITDTIPEADHYGEMRRSCSIARHLRDERTKRRLSRQADKGRQES